MMIEKTGAYKVSEFRRIFYGRFPYRVKLVNPYEAMSRHPQWNGDLSTIGHWVKTTEARHSRYLAKNRQFLEEVLEDYDQPEKDWMLVTTPATHMFYFSNAEGFEKFLDLNGHMIAETTAPESEEQIDVLNTDNAAVPILRERLFKDQYEWKIVFRKDCDAATIDQWVNEVLGDDISRSFYNSENRQRTLYLSDDSDLCIVRLSHYDSIERFEQVILRK